MKPNTESTLSPIDCRARAEHIILERKPFMLITLGENSPYCLIHIGEGDNETKSKNHRNLDLTLLEMTEHIPEITKALYIAFKTYKRSNNEKDPSNPR